MTPTFKKTTKCKNGEHNFIVNRWLIQPGQQTAIGYICQHCLVHIEGQSEAKRLMDCMHVDQKAD